MINQSLVVFLTASYPSPSKTVEFMASASEAGADVLELGIPFSDPVADGKTIQESYVRALKDFRLSHIFEILRKFRGRSDTPVVVMSYFNPIFKMGMREFVESTYSSGGDAILVVDLPFDMADDFVEICRDVGIENVFLAAPNTSEERLRAIDELSSFVYIVSTYGVTGERNEISPLAFRALERAKKVCSKPVAVGFGVSKPEHVKQLFDAGADGVVVGSAYVRLINELGENAAGAIRELTRKLLTF